MIGIQLATTDGVLSKAGGRVVKNVAGYDLSKLVTGSFGSLAAIVSATFKLAPLPAASKTMRVAVRDADGLADIVRTMMASQLEPVAFEVRRRLERRTSTSGLRSLRVSSVSPRSQPSSMRRSTQATAALKACALPWSARRRQRSARCGTAMRRKCGSKPGAIVRASWLPATSPGLKRSSGAGIDACAAMSLVGRAAIGAGRIRIDARTAAQAATRAAARVRVFGNIVIVRGSNELKAIVDVWGSHGDRQPLFDSLKRAFDPNGC